MDPFDFRGLLNDPAFYSCKYIFWPVAGHGVPNPLVVRQGPQPGIEPNTPCLLLFNVSQLYFFYFTNKHIISVDIAPNIIPIKYPVAPFSSRKYPTEAPTTIPTKIIDTKSISLLLTVFLYYVF